MASVSTYLNFSNYTEEAFNYYKSVFGGEFFWKWYHAVWRYSTFTGTTTHI